jgi:hypothetical protein
MRPGVLCASVLKLLWKQEAIEAAQARLQGELESSASSVGNVVLGFQGGSLKADGAWFKALDFWYAHRQAQSLERPWNGFGHGNPFARNGLSISVEVNPPRAGITRKVAGVFAEDEGGDVYLVHRGNVGGGRKGVGKSSFVAAYPEPLETMIEDHGTADVIVVGMLGAPTLVAQIEHFVALVESIKRQLVAEVPKTLAGKASAAPGSPKQDVYADEFAGKKTYTTKARVEANVLHGVVVRHLKVAVEKLGHKAYRDRARDLYLLGLSGKLRALFEVKTDVSTTSVYTAVGQLLMHGDNGVATRLVAVLPDTIDDARLIRLAGLGIKVVTFAWQSGLPKFEGLHGSLS